MKPERFKGVEPGDIKRCKNVIPPAYREADHLIGRMLSLMDEHTTLIVVSDHGMRAMDAPLTKYKLQIENLLRILRLEEACMPVQVGFRWYPHHAKDAMDVQNAMNVLAGTIVKETGKKVFEGIECFPSYITFLASSATYEGLLNQTSVLPPVAEMDASDLLRSSHGIEISGTHSEEGGLVLYGSAIRQGITLSSASILDVAPTTLLLLGMPIAREMEGKPLTAALRESFLESYPVTYIDTYEDDFHSREDSSSADLSAPGIELLKERLRGLGYL